MSGQPLDISTLVLWAVALGSLLNFALTIWNLLSSGSRTNALSIAEHGKRLDNHDLRMGSMEQAQRTSPTSAQVHHLDLAMEQLRGEIKTTAAVMTGHADLMERLEAVVTRHENHLISRG